MKIPGELCRRCAATDTATIQLFLSLSLRSFIKITIHMIYPIQVRNTSSGNKLL